MNGVVKDIYIRPDININVCYDENGLTLYVETGHRTSVRVEVKDIRVNELRNVISNLQAVYAEIQANESRLPAQSLGPQGPSSR